MQRNVFGITKQLVSSEYNSLTGNQQGEGVKTMTTKSKRGWGTTAAVAVLLAGALFWNQQRAQAMEGGIQPGAPLEEPSVSALTALDHAVEAVAARVTPAVVNVAVTAKSKAEASAMGIPEGALPPGFQPFFFGPGGRMRGGKMPEQVEHGVGSGVIVSPEGYIVTNAHVVEGATEIRVTLNDRRVFPAKLVGVDKLNDLAVIRIEAKGLTAVAWGDSAKLHPGQTVLAFGSPFGYFQFSVTRGIVSALNRPNPYSDDARKPGAYIQTDAAINPGNSGGPLVNAYGELIGINTFIISGSGSFAGAGFAIPSQIVRATAESLIKDGTVHHGYLGITMNDVTPENAEFFQLPDASGAVASQVVSGSPAADAGLKTGDVLREIDGQKIANGSALQVIVSQTAPGTTINLGILRSGKPETLKVKVGEYQAKSGQAENEEGGEKPHGRLGLTIAPLDEEDRAQLKLPAGSKGVAVESVRGGSPAEDAGLAEGDVILEINRHTVNSPEEFAREVKAAAQAKNVLLLVWSHGGASYRVVHLEGRGSE
jgi:serine protease Do